MSKAQVQANIRTIRAVPWNGWRALLVFLLPWIVLPLAAVIILGLIAQHSAGAAHLLQALGNNDPNASFALVLVDDIGSLSLIGYYLHKYHANWRDLGLRPFSVARALLYVLGLLVAFSIIVGLAYAAIQLLDPSFNANQPQVNEFTQRPSALSLWALVIIPPLVEEATFRGFMFPAFAKRFGLIGGALLTSVLFGFAHLQPNVVVYTFILSLVLCFLYVRLGSIIPGIGLHMLNNYIAYSGLHK